MVRCVQCSKLANVITNVCCSVEIPFMTKYIYIFFKSSMPGFSHSTWASRVGLWSVFIALWTLAFISIWTNHGMVWHSATLSRQYFFHLNIFVTLIKVSFSFTVADKLIIQELSCGVFGEKCVCAEHSNTVNDFVSVCTDFRSQTSWETGVASMMQNSEFILVCWYCHLCFWCYCIYECGE